MGKKARQGIVAVDLGTNMGVAWCSGDRLRWSHVNLARLTGSTNDDDRKHGMWTLGVIDILGRVLRDIEANHSALPSVIIYEQVTRHVSMANAQVYGALRGALLGFAYQKQIDVLPIIVQHWKMGVGLKGNAPKDAVLAWAERSVGAKVSQDVADALGLLCTGLKDYTLKLDAFTDRGSFAW